MNSHEVFIHIHQGCFAGTGAIVRLPQCQWSKPDGYGKISQCITTTKHSKAKTVCIFLGIYCMSRETRDMLSASLFCMLCLKTAGYKSQWVPLLLLSVDIRTINIECSDCIVQLYIRIFINAYVNAARHSMLVSIILLYYKTKLCVLSAVSHSKQIWTNFTYRWVFLAVKPSTAMILVQKWHKETYLYNLLVYDKRRYSFKLCNRHI